MLPSAEVQPLHHYQKPRNAVPLAVARKPLRAVRPHPRAQGTQAPSTEDTLLQVAIQTSLAIRRWHTAGRTLLSPATLYRYAIQPALRVCFLLSSENLMQPIMSSESQREAQSLIYQPTEIGTSHNSQSQILTAKVHTD